jgi:hypothetical protein
MTPKCRSSAITEAPEEIASVFFPNKIWRENVTCGAAQPKQKSELPQSAGKAGSGARAKAAYGGADTFPSKVFVGTLAAEGHCA